MKNIFEILKPPFYYDDYGQMIFDKDNNLALDVRGWGLIQREENAEDIQDNFGKMVAEALNNFAQQTLSDSEDKSSTSKCRHPLLRRERVDKYTLICNECGEKI